MDLAAQGGGLPDPGIASHRLTNRKIDVTNEPEWVALTGQTVSVPPRRA
jgi:hypothetical protein